MTTIHNVQKGDYHIKEAERLGFYALVEKALGKLETRVDFLEMIIASLRGDVDHLKQESFVPLETNVFADNRLLSIYRSMYQEVLFGSSVRQEIVRSVYVPLAIASFVFSSAMLVISSALITPLLALPFGSAALFSLYYWYRQK